MSREKVRPDRLPESWWGEQQVPRVWGARVCLSYSLGKPFSRNQHLYRSLICSFLICKPSDEMEFVLPGVISQGSGLWARGSLPLGQVVEINGDREHRLRNRVGCWQGQSYPMAYG